MGYNRYRRKDGKPSDPAKQRQGRSNRARGAAFERRIVALYRKHGWHVQHNTKGIYDMVCTPPDTQPAGDEPYILGQRITHFLQPTITRYPPKEKKMNLIENDNKWIGDAYLVQREDSYPFKLIFTPVSELKVK